MGRQEPQTGKAGEQEELFCVAHSECRANLFAYIFCAAKKSTDCVVFLATRCEKETGGYLHSVLRSVVCKRFSTPTSAALGSRITRGFVRETGRRDLRRPSGHPASLRLPAQGGAGGAFPAHANSALSDS